MGVRQYVGAVVAILSLLLFFVGCVRTGSNEAPVCLFDAAPPQDATRLDHFPPADGSPPADGAAGPDSGAIDGPTPPVDGTTPPVDMKLTNYYLHFGSKAEYVRLDNAMNWGADFTVALRIRLTATPAAYEDYLTSFYYDPLTSTLSGWEIGFKDNLKPRWFLVNHDKDPYPGKCEKTSTKALKLNTWYLITFVFDYTSSTTAQYRLHVGGQIWIDMSSAGSTCSKTMAPGPFGADAFRLGGMNNVKLDIDDLRLFNRALSPTEVSTMAGGSPPAGVMLHWPMNEGSGTTLKDASGNNRTGTAHSPDWKLHVP